jgi:hypothetical protein
MKYKEANHTKDNQHRNEKKIRDLSPLANYTDRATAACR